MIGRESATDLIFAGREIAGGVIGLDAAYEASADGLARKRPVMRTAPMLSCLLPDGPAPPERGRRSGIQLEKSLDRISLEPPANTETIHQPASER
jgi:hypothetical protein